MFLKHADMFYLNINFCYKSHFGFRTITGGLITVITYIFFLYIILMYIQNWYNRYNPIISYYQENLSLNADFNEYSSLPLKLIPFYFNITTFSKNNFTFDPFKLIDIELQELQDDKNVKLSQNLKRCKEVNLSNYDKNAVDIMFKNISEDKNNLFCLDVNKFMSIKPYKRSNSMIFNFTFRSPLKNSSDFYTEEEMKNLYSINIDVNFYENLLILKKSVFNITTQENKGNFNFDFDVSLDKLFRKYTTASLFNPDYRFKSSLEAKKFQYNTDYGLFFRDWIYQTYHSLSAYDDERYENYDDEISFYILELKLIPYSEVVSVTFLSIIEILSKIGGMMKFLSYIIYLVRHHIYECLFLKEITNYFGIKDVEYENEYGEIKKIPEKDEKIIPREDSQQNLSSRLIINNKIDEDSTIKSETNLNFQVANNSSDSCENEKKTKDFSNVYINEKEKNIDNKDDIKKSKNFFSIILCCCFKKKKKSKEDIIADLLDIRDYIKLINKFSSYQILKKEKKKINLVKIESDNFDNSSYFKCAQEQKTSTINNPNHDDDNLTSYFTKKLVK